MLASLVLRDRPVRLLWSSQLLFATGYELQTVAVIWIASTLAGGEAGYIAALQAGAVFLGGLFSGLVTERWRNGTTMVGVAVLRAALLLALSAASALGLLSLPVLALLACALALVGSAYDPALQATIPAIAPDPARAHAVNVLFDATKRLARVLGPGLVGLAGGLLPVGQFFTVTAASSLVAALGVHRALRDLPPTPVRAGRGLAAALDTILGGLRAIRHHRVLQFGLVAELVGNVGWSMGILLGMVLHLRAGSATPLLDYSIMMTAYGLSSVAVNLALSRCIPRRPLLWLSISKLLFGFGVFFLPFSSGRAWLVGFAAIAAANGPFETLALLRIVQTDFPPESIARVYRLIVCGIFGGMLAGYLAAPLLFAGFGIGPVISASGLLVFLCGCGGLLLHRRLGREAGAS